MTHKVDKGPISISISSNKTEEQWQNQSVLEREARSFALTAFVEQLLKENLL